jgi:hypothetical protein
MKILIIITSPLFIRNYVETDAFKKIRGRSTFIACTSNLTHKNKIINHENFAGEFEASSLNKKLFTFFTSLLMYSNRKVNKGFYFYFKVRNPTIYYRSIRLKNKVSKWFKNKILQNITISILEFMRPFSHPINLLRFCIIVLIDHLHLSNLSIKIYNSLIASNKQLISIVEAIKPDLVIMPNGGLDENAHEALSLSTKSNFKTMLMIDNWDNLCSKSRFPIEADYFGVWGEQAKGHAIKMHQIDPTKIYLTGTPRFDVYKNYKSQKIALQEKYQKVLDFPYILFAGCWPAFDEIEVLEILNGLIEKYSNSLPPKCKILYRPHPWGESFDKLGQLISKNLKNIEIDPQMSINSRPDDYRKRTDFQPELDYYPFLLDKSEFVICPLATIIIEASLMGKKVLALKHDDGKSFYNPAFLYQNSDYFEGLSDLNSVLFLEDLKNLDNLFSQMISSNAEVDRKALSYFIVDDDLLYPDRIEKICNELPLN